MNTRERLYPEIKRLREDEGLKWREIGERLGISLKSAHEYYMDPTGEKMRARKARKDGNCADCGARTVSDGKTPERCGPCAHAASKVWTRDAIVAAIQRWADAHGGVPPVARDWNTTVARQRGKPDRGDGFPATNTVRNTFGTWNAAITAAGFVPFDIGHYGRDGEDPEVVAESVRLYRSGLSTTQVGQRMGVSSGTISARLRAAGEPSRRAVTRARRSSEGKDPSVPSQNSRDDLPDTLPDDPNGSALVIRAELGVDLTRARVIVEQARVTAPFARFHEPSDLQLYRGLLEQARGNLSRASALLAAQTFKHRPEEM